MTSGRTRVVEMFTSLVQVCSTRPPTSGQLLSLARLALVVALAMTLTMTLLAGRAEAGGNKGNKGGGEGDIILYNGQLVMRGDEGGGSIVMADNKPPNEEVEFMPSFFDFGSDFARRRRRRR